MRYGNTRHDRSGGAAQANPGERAHCQERQEREIAADAKYWRPCLARRVARLPERIVERMRLLLLNNGRAKWQPCRWYPTACANVCSYGELEIAEAELHSDALAHMRMEDSHKRIPPHICAEVRPIMKQGSNCNASLSGIISCCSNIVNVCFRIPSTLFPTLSPPNSHQSHKSTSPCYDRAIGGWTDEDDRR